MGSITPEELADRMFYERQHDADVEVGPKKKERGPYKGKLHKGRMS